MPSSDENMITTLSSHSAGFLFKKYSLLVLSAMIIWFAWAGQTNIVFLLGLILATTGFAKLWAKLALIRVTCIRTPDKMRVFPGDIVLNRLEVVNRKLLPLPWLEVTEEIPLALMESPPIESSDRHGFGVSRCNIALRWYSSVTWEHTFKCRRRGVYRLGPLKFTSGDIFGFFAYTRQRKDLHDIVVYPKIYSLSGASFPSRIPLGESKADQDIFHDPSRVIGIRDYTLKDSLRHVHWKASAKRQHLQVKEFESTLTLTTALFLDADGFGNDQTGREKFEIAVSTVASIAVRLIQQKGRVGLYLNTRSGNGNRSVNLPPACSHEHLIHILEILAMVNARPAMSFEAFLLKAHHMLPMGCTLIAIVRALNQKIIDCLRKLKANGCNVILISIEEIPLDHLDPGVNQFQATLHAPSDQIHFRKAIL